MYKIRETVRVFESTLHKKINCQHSPKKTISEFVKFGGIDCVRFRGSNIPHAIDCIGKLVPTCKLEITWKNKKTKIILVAKDEVNDFVHQFAADNGFETEIDCYGTYGVGFHRFDDGSKCRSIDISNFL
jgi:hypothetical protein